MHWLFFMEMKNKKYLFYRSAAPRSCCSSFLWHAACHSCGMLFAILVRICWLQCHANNCKYTDSFLWEWISKNIFSCSFLSRLMLFIFLWHAARHSCGMLLAILVMICWLQCHANDCKCTDSFFMGMKNEKYFFAALPYAILVACRHVMICW